MSALEEYRALINESLYFRVAKEAIVIAADAAIAELEEDKRVEKCILEFAAARISGERERAERGAREARRIPTIVVELLGYVIDPDGEGPFTLVVEVTDKASGRLYSMTVCQPREGCE